MSNPVDNPLEGVDRPRPLREPFRARLEGELLAANSTDGSTDGNELPTGIDRPRPIPPEARERIEAQLLKRLGSDRTPMPLPVQSPGRPSITGRYQRWVPAVAAVVVLMVAATSLIMTTREDGSVAGQADSLATGSPEAALDSAGAGGVGFAPPPFTVVDDGPDAPAPGPEQAPSAAAGRTSEDFAAESAAPMANGDSIFVELAGPDSDVSAGFLAYLALVSDQGGVNGSPLAVAAPEQVDQAVATVNTSLTSAIAPGGRRPLLEGPAATGRLLAGQVFSFSAAPERLAYLAVDGLDLKEARVAVFSGSGVFADVVPDAFSTALRSQTSEVERVPGGGQPTRWPEADLAVLAMDSDDTRAWLEAASRRGYGPRLGVSGIYNLADPTVASQLPEGSAVVSPYAAPQPGEAEAMARAAGGVPSFGFTHGWVTGKALALALWRSAAATPEELGAALGNLSGEDLNGMIAPYSVRPGTNSRTPEGILSKVKGDKLVALGGFRSSGRT